MTAAEMVVYRFKHAMKTISIPVLAKDYAATREGSGSELVYNFPDGSRLTTTGRGRKHTMRVENRATET